MMRKPVLALLCAICAIPIMAQDHPAHTPPLHEMLPASPDIIWRRDYRQVIGAVNIHDAPNGNVLRTRPAGTFFVTVSSYQGDWAEINPGEWIPASTLLPAPPSYLGGVFLDDTDNQPQLALLHESVYLRTTPGNRGLCP